jgi:hypothetical protein
MAKPDNKLTSSLGPGDMDDFRDSLIPNYFTKPAVEPEPEPEPEPVNPITVPQAPANVDELLKQLEPYKAPEPEPEPQPQPAPQPEPEPQPQPAPQPEPEPQLQPTPAPQPEPEPQPTLEPITVQPEPTNIDELLKQLEPYKAPEPEPEPEPTPAPVDFWEPNPIEPEPEPEPTPAPVDFWEPNPIEPEPEPTPAPPSNDDERIPELVMTAKRPDEEPTVTADPYDLSAFLRSLWPYASETEPGTRTIPAERPSSITEKEFPPIEQIPFDPMTLLPTLPTLPVETPKISAPVKTPTVSAPTTPTVSAPAATSSGMDLSSLLALLSAGQQPTQQAPMQDPYAHIKLMEELFGSNIDLTPAGEDTAKRK